VFLVPLLGGCSELDRELTLVRPPLMLDQRIALEFAQIFDEDGDIRIRLIDNPDPDQPAFTAVMRGEADLALVSNAEKYDPRLATILPLYPTVLHIAYRESVLDPSLPPMRLIRELGTHAVYGGPPGSPSRLLLSSAARRAGMDPEAIAYTEAAGCPDVIVVYVPILREVDERIARCGNYRLYGLGAPEDIGTGSFIDSVTLLEPHLEPFVIPAGTYGSLTPEPVLTLAVDNVLVGRTDLPDGIVYDLLADILRQKAALSAEHPGLFHRLTEHFDVSSSAFGVHPGALAYLQRDEPDLYERYSGVAEVAVSLGLALLSGLYALYRFLSIRRKNRVDAFIREALAIRDEALEDERAWGDAVVALQALKDRAFREMIGERLAADESFQIFVGLANDLLADLSRGPDPG
jgi:hypothetical protein